MNSKNQAETLQEKVKAIADVPVATAINNLQTEYLAIAKRLRAYSIQIHGSVLNMLQTEFQLRQDETKNAIQEHQHQVAVQLLLHVPVCRECGRAFYKNDAGGLDLAAAIEAEIKILEANHVKVMAHAQASGVPIKLGPLATLVPDGYKVSFHGPYKMLRALRQIK